MAFNEGQLKAILQRKSSILVSAPAGSGKTKILVSRIIELLKEGYNISDFLVLTFTEAAGNEMKQRLVEELNELVSQDIDDHLRDHLSLQIQNLPHAYITNFHGFCNLLLTKYGYLVNVMPGFEINSDPSLIKREVLHECEMKWVNDDDFKTYMSIYFPGYNFTMFEDLLLNIDSISHSIDDFYGFVEDMKTNVYGDMKTLDDWILFPRLKQLLIDECITSMDKLVETYEYAASNGLSDFYERPDEQNEKNQLLYIPFESYYDYLDERIKALSNTITYDSMVSLLSAPLPKAYNMNFKEVDKEIKDAFNKKKNDILSGYKNAVKNYLEEDQEEYIKKLHLSLEIIVQLVSSSKWLQQFQVAYSLRKKELNQLDFNDLESYTHQLLLPEYGVSEALYNRLKEIMVDEYQDTNQIQESLILKIARFKDPEIDLFMVGDMKQSIYRFRQADPAIFSYKYDTFSLSDEECLKTKTKRIDLVFNYRSSKVVLDSINYIFNAIMDKDIGGLDYYLDDSARLNYDYIGIKGDQKDIAREEFFNDNHLTTEVLIDLYNPKSKLDKDSYEAHMVAQKILELRKTMKLKGKPVDYKDMVVLMRSTPSFLTFKKVFDLYNIPNHIVLSQGFNKSIEIVNMITFLKALDNPYNDIALLSVLRLPYTFTHIPLDLIAKIRNSHKDLSLYDGLLNSDNECIISFIEIFEYLRMYSNTHSPYDLLKEIYKLTEYPLFVSKLINGAQRKANLELLLEVVYTTQESIPYLKDLVIYLEEMSDLPPAKSSSSDNNAVEFMTIHKSKGLECPIVFVCNMHKKFNTQDSKERFIIDKQLGMAIKPRRLAQLDDYEVIAEYDNCFRNMIAKNQLNESINEEMRILYVALTRASSKLILTGMIKDMKEISDIQEKLIINESDDIKHKDKDHIILYNRFRKTNNYLSWVLSAILRHSSIIDQCLEIEELSHYARILKTYNFDKKLTFPSTEHAKFSLTLTNDAKIEEHIPIYHKEDHLIDISTQDYYRNYKYPYDTTKPLTLAVTALAKHKDDHFIQFDSDFNKNSISAADKGTLVHLFMSYLNFKDDHIDELIHQLFNETIIDETGKQVLEDYKDHLLHFINSPYYKMISKASYIYKEKKFSYYDKDLDQIIHGIFDLVFVYNDNIYVLDYKTDKVTEDINKQDMIDRHSIQLNYYKKVLGEMYNKDVKAILYYLHIDKGVEF